MQCEHISERERFKSLAAVSGLFYKNTNCRISWFLLPFFAFFIKLCNLLCWKAIFLRNLYFKKEKGIDLLKANLLQNHRPQLELGNSWQATQCPLVLQNLEITLQVQQDTVGLTHRKWSTFRCSFLPLLVF